jgi:NADH-quinone oxidoreductase subunit L
LKVSTISVTGWEHTLGEVEGLPLEFASCGHFHCVGVACHFDLMAHVWTQSAQAGSDRPAQESRLVLCSQAWKTNGSWMKDISPHHQPVQEDLHFLADVIDWRFWHDFVHDTVILGTYNWLSEIALERICRSKRH